MIELHELTESGHEVAERLWQLFLHDLTELRDSHPDEDGLFGRRHLERAITNLWPRASDIREAPASCRPRGRA